MKLKRGLLIINPVSGTRSKSGLQQTVESRLREAGIIIETKFTGKSGDAFSFASEAGEQGFDLVISAGGDGTVNEIAGALSHTGLPLGIIPLGSGNGLARSLGIPQDVGEALKIIAEGNIMVCDRGMVNGKPFYCTFGIGFDALVSEKFASTKKRGRITYITNVLREFTTYQSQPYAISIGGKVFTEKAFLIAVCNAPQYGNNAYIAPHAKLTDGLLDITVVHSDTPLTFMLLGVNLMTGYIDRNTRIDTFRVSSASISRLHDGPVHLDGEPYKMGKKLNFTCDPKAISVFAPKKIYQFRPLVSPLRAMFEDMRYDMKSKFNP